MMDFTDKRLSYEKGELHASYAPSNPFDLFKHWMNEALEHKVTEPYAMSLATCGEDRMPSVRTVLMREITESGIVFYTNYLSDKGIDIAQNPQAESLFFWSDMQRQVRLRGDIIKIDSAKSATYFRKRPYDSQIGAWASQPQSGVVASREALENIYEALKLKYPEEDGVPMPDFWGGYEIIVSEIEFWQGRPSRLHDRLLYTKALALKGSDLTEASVEDLNNAIEAQWSIKRLKP